MAVLPFAMNADRDLSFLQEGIVDMISSRIAWKGELEVLEKGLVRKEMAKYKPPLNRETALEIGKNLQADYVILGSLTVFGESVSVDAKILDVNQGDELVTAFNQAKGMDAVIPTVTQFAEDINEKIMGRPMASRSQPASEGPEGPGGLHRETMDFEGKGVNHTQGVRTEIVSLDAGDVDGDGKSDLVFISNDTVFIYKWGPEKGFIQFKTVKEKWATNQVYVTVADLNGNGRCEIYVADADKTSVSSFALEWDGTNFAKVAAGVPWFWRVIEMPGRGKVLVGQKREAGMGYLGDVFFLAKEGDRYVSTEPVPLPRDGNVFNFTFADFGGTGKVDTLFLDSADFLRLLESGEEIWRSEEPFGGTYTFFEASQQAEFSRQNIFIQSPIFVTDVDQDGRKEMMVCRNTSKVGRFLDKFRSFSGGTLHFLERDQTGLSPKWRTKRLGGAIVGYTIADVDGDNLPELVIASVMREENLLGNPRSRIVVYDLK